MGAGDRETWEQDTDRGGSWRQTEVGAGDREMREQETGTEQGEVGTEEEGKDVLTAVHTPVQLQRYRVTGPQLWC